MKLKVVRIGEYDYARVSLLEMEGERLTAALELPLKLLEEVGWRPAEGDEVELELTEASGSLEEWDIVMSGKLLKADEGTATYTFGGLLLTVRGEGLVPQSKVYLKLKRLVKG